MKKSDFTNCLVCGNPILKSEGHEVIGYGHICNTCFNSNGSYNYENDIIRNEKTLKGITFSMEFETDHHDENICRLYKWNFVPTSDCSIYGREWKSPIWNSLKGIKAMFEEIDRYNCNEQGKYITRRTGTHVHVGTLDRVEKYLIHYFRNEIFRPMLTFTENMNTNDRIRIWGRDFTSYADRYLDGDHSSFINTNTDCPTIEFRLCKYVNANQFYTLLETVTKITEVVLKDIRKNKELCNKFYNYDNSYRSEIYALTNEEANKIKSIFKKIGFKVLKEYRCMINL